MGKRVGAEKAVAAALESQARQGDVILTNVRFTDPKDGDVEADFLLLMPEYGVAAIEVKGGLVSFQDGEWRVNGISDPTYSRRIHPIEQARRAKHALRRYLDRQPEWTSGLVRADWLVVFPETDVVGDLGPEGLREHLVGAGGLADLRARARALLDRPVHGEPRPTAEQIQDAVSLVFRSGHTSAPEGVGAPKRRFLQTPRSRRWVALGLGAALALGIGLAVANTGGAEEAEKCSPGYLPCIPVAEDLDCPEIRQQVEIIGEDTYGLDRDGNGFGCEMFAVPA